MAPASTLLRNAIKGVACMQTSALLGMQLKRSCLQKVVLHLGKFIIPSAVAVLAVSLSRSQNGKKL